MAQASKRRDPERVNAILDGLERLYPEVRCELDHETPLQLLIATYGGYFGGGMGIMMLAAMAVAGMTDMHEMNGLKTILAIAINGVALAAFIVSGSIAWMPGLVMVAGGVTGGYVGASLARRVAGPSVRLVVIAVAWSMTVYFFVR